MTHSGNSSSEGPDERPPGSTSTSLIDRARQGDADGWRRLVFLYTPLVRWWCRRQGLRHPDAEDVGQEVFRAVHGKIVDFQKQHPGGFRGWLRAFTENKLRDWRRREKGQPPADGGSDAREILENLPADSSGDCEVPDHALERVILVRRAMELVRAEFEPRTWQAAWRVLVDGQRPKQVAEELGMTTGAVRTAKSRVLRRLRQELGDLPDGEEAGDP